jgi:hypothetical protein
MDNEREQLAAKNRRHRKRPSKKMRIFYLALRSSATSGGPSHFSHCADVLFEGPPVSMVFYTPRVFFFSPSSTLNVHRQQSE